jgi:hypothetical protein
MILAVGDYVGHGRDICQDIEEYFDRRWTASEAMEP